MNLEQQLGEATRLRQEEDRRFFRFVVKCGVGVIVGILVLIGALMWIVPNYRLYKANIEKQTLVSTAKAKADAAEFTAQTEVTKAEYEAERDRIRAKGVADANSLIASSLTPEYITWHYVDTLAEAGNQIIYVPTEGGIPILEAGRNTELNK